MQAVHIKYQLGRHQGDQHLDMALREFLYWVIGQHCSLGSSDPALNKKKWLSNSIHLYLLLDSYKVWPVVSNFCCPAFLVIMGCCLLNWKAKQTLPSWVVSCQAFGHSNVKIAVYVRLLGDNLLYQLERGLWNSACYLASAEECPKIDWSHSCPN